MVDSDASFAWRLFHLNWIPIAAMGVVLPPPTNSPPSATFPPLLIAREKGPGIPRPFPICNSARGA